MTNPFSPALPVPVAPPAGPVPDLAGFAHAYADVNGTRLHYVVGDTARP
jgi:hypothetical protein